MGNTKSPYVTTTTTTISTAELTQAIQKGAQLFADLSINAGYANLYHMTDDSQPTRLRLYLALYALQSWDTNPNAMNFFDQTHLIKLMSMVEQYFYIANVAKPC